MIILGGINKITKEYIYPKIANKNDKYICSECNKDLILKNKWFMKTIQEYIKKKNVDFIKKYNLVKL